MSLPRRLSFLNDQAGLAIRQEPVTAPLRIKHDAILPTQGGKLGSSFQEAPFELDLRFNQSSELVFGVRLYRDEKHWTEVGFDRPKGEFYIRSQSGLRRARHLRQAQSKAREVWVPF
jgi:fructan beta-fructosidase